MRKIRINRINRLTSNGIVSLLLIFITSFLLLPGCESDNFNDIIDRESVQEDLPIPGNSGSILVSGITSDSVTLSWNSARDESTPAGELQYMVVKSLYDNISDTDAAMANGTVELAWTAGSSTYTATGLDSGEIFYFNILVKDRDGYISAYTKVSVITVGSSFPGTDPVPGNSGALTVSGISSSGFTLTWTKATDAETAQGYLQYQVSYSLADNISTYSDAQANGTEATLGWTSDINTINLTGLSPSTQYYVNVFVRDGDSMISAYAGTSATTDIPSIYLFSAGGHKGDLGGRVGADRICREYYDATGFSLPVSNVRAFISISAADQIADFPANFGVPAGAAIKGVYSGTVIADDWRDLTDATIDVALNSAGVGTPLNAWWSGSNFYGEWTVSATSCNGFTDGSNGVGGYTGDHVATGASWITYQIPTCNSIQTLMCIGW